MPGRKNTWASPPAATPAETFRTARETPALDSSSPNDSYFPQVAAEAADNGRPSSTSRDDNRSSEELLSQDLDAVSHADKLLAQHVGPIVESPGNPYFTTVPPPPTSSFGTVLPNGPPTAPATTSPNRSSFSRTGQGHNPTLPPGQAPNWREIKGNIRRIVKFNRSGAQVACTILLVSLLSLIKPLEERFPSNTVYVVIAAIVVAEPNQTASLRLLMQRLIGVLIAGVVSLAILGLDAIVWPQNCLNCSYKPYVVGGLLFVFIYIVVSVRESVPGQAYSSKLMDLTFVVLLLGAYNDLLKSPDSPRYAPPLARMASVVVGVALTTAGAFIFWPQRLTVVHRVVTAKLFKDMASYFHDLVENGYTSLPSHPNDAFNQSIYRLEPGWTATTRTIAVEGGMEVLGSQEAVTAQGEHRSKKKSPKSRPGVGGLFGRQPPVPVPVPDIETGSIQQPSEVNCGSSVASEPAFADWGRIMTDTTIPELEDHPDLARKFHEKTHPAAVHIIRTLEKERARLEASYKVEVRWTQTPHFVPIGPLDQVIRRLRLLFYQLSGLYSDRLITLRALSPRMLDSAQLTGSSSLSEWVLAWTSDATIAMRSMTATPTGPTPTSSTSSQMLNLVTYTSHICSALVDLGDIVLWTTNETGRTIGTAELAALLEVVIQDTIKHRDTLEKHLLGIRGQLMKPPSQSVESSKKLGKAPSSPCFNLNSGPVSGDFTSIPHLGTQNATPVLAIQYATYVQLWEITEVLLSSAKAVGAMLKVYA